MINNSQNVKRIQEISNDCITLHNQLNDLCTNLIKYAIDEQYTVKNLYDMMDICEANYNQFIQYFECG